MKNSILLSFVLFLFSSCAMHTGIMNSSASLSSNNFRYVKSVSGEAKTIKILGVGGLNKNGLVAEAKKNLLQNYPLSTGQTLANISVDFKHTFVILYLETKVIVTADIVEFNK